jgi:hypothetical protein
MTVVALLGFGCTPPPPLPPIGKPQVDQGPNWTLATRAQFYSQDQGSEIMPILWFKALKQPNGDPFLTNSLTRYGYLVNNENPTSILPVGFTSAGPIGGESLGMTCAACHTRQIDVNGTQYRIDGGPAIADFQSFLADLDTAVNTVITNPAAFQNFAQNVLSQPSTPAQQAQLMADVQAWYLRYHTLMQRALPPSPWGPSRLDAVAMIFNRLSGLDLGPAPSHLLPMNIQVADAPVRYPFLWNAPVQDLTQWPGFAGNGNDFYGLTRNLGEVFGVFATFHPEKDPNRWLFKVNYVADNSANFSGLQQLEDLVKKIGPPKFPWPIDAALAKQGEAIFNRPTAQGGCVECHGIAPGIVRFYKQATWATPVLDVGTDSREYNILTRTVDPGVLTGARILTLGPLKSPASAIDVLAMSVAGSIIQTFIPVEETTASAQKKSPLLRAAANTEAVLGAMPEAQEALTTFTAPTSGTFKYESRVMQGIWAAAPYLHNGSVPTLADLLNPSTQRPVSFKVGPTYDPVNVGLAKDQTKFNYVLTTTGCSDRNSGNSRCGHEFGTTTLTPAEKKALLEYLKQL